MLPLPPPASLGNPSMFRRSVNRIETNQSKKSVYSWEKWKRLTTDKWEPGGRDQTFFFFFQPLWLVWFPGKFSRKKKIQRQLMGKTNTNVQKRKWNEKSTPLVWIPTKPNTLITQFPIWVSFIFQATKQSKVRESLGRIFKLHKKKKKKSEWMKKSTPLDWTQLIPNTLMTQIPIWGFHQFSHRFSRQPNRAKTEKVNQENSNSTEKRVQLRVHSTPLDRIQPN